MTAPRLVTEFIGTFFLVLVIALVVPAEPRSPIIALAIGLTLMVMVYMGGHISGAHYNPAVSLAVFMRQKLTAAEMGAYWLVQLLAGMVAATMAWYMTGKTVPIAPGGSVGLPIALLAEVVFTFALALVVLNVAVSERTKGNSYYGLAIGMTVTAAAVAVGGISGGALNPAVGLGLTTASALFGGGTWGSAWLFVVGPLVGAALAALVFGLQERSA